MSFKKINEFFVPSGTPPASKRQRSSSSPTLTDRATTMDQKVGDLTQAQLMEGLSRLLEDKLSNLVTKEDMQHLSSRIDALEKENNQLREELSALRRSETAVKDKIVDLESRSRRNNLIFRGLRVPDKSTDYCKVVRDFCTQVMGCRDTLWVNRAHPLGRDKRTIIAHLPDDGDIHYIMSRVKILKGTGYTVHRDFPWEIREKRANLMKVRAEVERVAGRRRMPIVHDHLTIEGCKFSWVDGKLRAGPVDGGERLKDVTGRDFSEFLAKLQRGDADQDQTLMQTEVPIPGGSQSITQDH